MGSGETMDGRRGKMKGRRAIKKKGRRGKYEGE